MSDISENGTVPDFEGKPIIASCINCSHCMDQSDGPEYGPSFYGCEKKGREFMSNLKGFPFKTPQKCFEISYIFMVDWDEEALS